MAGELPAVLRERVSDEVDWDVPVVVDELGADRATSGSEIIERARARMLDEGWNLAICLTDLPLRIGRRPVVADASAVHGVGLICLPALGARDLQRRATDAVVRVVEGLMAEPAARRSRDGVARRRVGRRLAGVAASVHRVVPDDEDIDLRFVSAVLRGNLRLLVGMVRANRPWRLASGLAKAVATALGAVAFSIVYSDVRQIAASLGWTRLLILTVVSIASTVVSLIAVHELWERSGRRTREQTLLFNVVTAATVTLGVVTLYVALFVLALAGAGFMLTGDVMQQSIGHRPGFGDYAHLAWMIGSIATVGGALAAGLEDDRTVRLAAYGYRARPDAETGR